jgi:cytochrome c6
LRLKRLLGSNGASDQAKFLRPAKQIRVCGIVREILLGRKNVKLLSLRLCQAMLLACGVMAVCSCSAAAQDAAATYRAKCAVCHGADGKGGKMGTKDFASPDIQGMTDAQLAEVITKGKAPKMPAFGDKLKDSDIKDLVAYIRTLGKK